jgi:pathogenesis-related protein 1
MTRTCGALVVLLAACGGSSSSGGPAANTSSSDAGGSCPDAVDACGFVTAHDAARAGAIPTPTPPLPATSWSTTAAAAAASWASQCTWMHDPALQTEGYGQNLYASTGVPNASTVVSTWAAESAFYDYASNSCGAGKVCGHYTQVVWRDSTALGCAVQHCSTGSPFEARFGTDWWLVACDYSPPGNWVGQRPY